MAFCKTALWLLELSTVSPRRTAMNKDSVRSRHKNDWNSAYFVCNLLLIATVCDEKNFFCGDECKFERVIYPDCSNQPFYCRKNFLRDMYFGQQFLSDLDRRPQEVWVYSSVNIPDTSAVFDLVGEHLNFQWQSWSCITNTLIGTSSSVSLPM